MIFCEILGCKKLIIEKNNIIFINHTIFYQKYNFTIEPNQAIGNCLDNNCMILKNWFFFHLDFKYIGNVDRLYSGIFIFSSGLFVFHDNINWNILKKEILKNLPNVKSHVDDLYIYIRSGDIFSSLKETIYTYAQPPLCFYQNNINSLIIC